MLTVEEQQNSIRYNIELDHCYTSRFCPLRPKPTDPLPDMNTSDIDESMCIDISKPTVQTPLILPVSSTNLHNASMTPLKEKATPIPPKIVKQPVLIGGRPRRASTAMYPTSNPLKSTASMNTRVVLNSLQQENKVEENADDHELFSSSESSESEESDSDSDFGPRPRRGVRARGGRRGLVTRGGSMSASRRRGSNKHMDSEQVRRLDLEMAAAVSAMKSPEKEEKSEKQSPLKIRKPLQKTFASKKKEDSSASSTSVSEPLPVEPNVLQTTNVVKANLISANMFKGDMILTKPGKDRNNQKVVFVQKQVVMNPIELKTLGIKKQVITPKTKITLPQSSKVSLANDVRVSSTPAILKAAMPIAQQPITVRQITTRMEPQTESVQNDLETHKGVCPSNVKIKPVEVRGEKKKVDVVVETPVKATVEPLKPVETKTITGKDEHLMVLM